MPSSWWRTFWACSWVVPQQSFVWIDLDAAGHGWVTDPSGPGMDLLTVVVHELGHVAGLEHDDEGVMQPVLSPGTRTAEDAVFVQLLARKPENSRRQATRILGARDGAAWPGSLPDVLDRRLCSVPDDGLVRLDAGSQSAVTPASGDPVAPLRPGNLRPGARDGQALSRGRGARAGIAVCARLEVSERAI